MATSGTREYPRELIIKDGYLKHREPGIVNRWRHRYVMFRTSTAGRFIFTVYRDKPAIPANEQTEVPIEDYGGLDDTLKLDGEKHVFAIITVGITECFAVDTPEQLQEWSSVLKDYLGQEMVMNIEVPYKQKSLRTGKAQMRIRNTGFTITSLDCPPRCTGSWQILHIRKFGGTDSFRFETGSKCPSGEYLYVIKAERLKKMKEVFTDLSHHKPIFQNDRTGRRMTREHRMLQQFKEKQQVGPRLSLQHSTPPMAAKKQHMFRKFDSGHELIRPRSNAVMTATQDSTDRFKPMASNDTNNGGMLKNSPSANDIEGYYNLPQVGHGNTKNDNKRKANSLNTASSPCSSSHDNVYYNRDAIELQLHQKTRRHGSDSDTNSDDDFVDINHLNKDNNYAYYNLRDSPNIMQKTNKTPEHLPAYENYKPKFQRGVSQSSADVTNESSALYNNIEAIQQEARNSNGSLHNSTTSAENVIITEPSPDREVNASSNGKKEEFVSSTSDTDSLDDMSSFRNRTTSIVEHVMISADQSTRSCENLLSADQPLWTGEEKPSTGNHSDSELLKGPSSSTVTTRKRKLSFKETKQKVAGSTDTSQEDYDYDQPSQRNSLPPTIGKPSPYDHLVLGSEQKTPSSEVVLRGVPYMKYMDTNGREVLVPLHRPSLPDQSTVINSFKNRKPRSHIYEAVEVPEDEGNSPSSSPESSTQSTPTHKQDLYKRKISLLGHDHKYEMVSQQKSPSPPAPEVGGGSIVKKTLTSITSPTRFTSSLRKNRKSPPAQQTKLPNETQLQTQPSSSPSVNKSPVKKPPVPIPRNVKAETTPGLSSDPMYVNGTVIQQQINNATNSTHDANTTTSSVNQQQHSTSTRESAYVNGSVIKEQINALEARESAYVNGTVIKQQMNALDKTPNVPPKPKYLANQHPEQTTQYKSALFQPDPYFNPADPTYTTPITNRMPRGRPRVSLQDTQPNYAEVYVHTEPMSLPRDKSKLSQSVTDKRQHPQTEYTQIDHFKTEKFHDLIEQRKQEKSLAALV